MFSIWMKKKIKILSILFILPAFLYCSPEKENHKTDDEKITPGAVYRVEIRDAITPATMEMLESSIVTASENNASALLVLLDTPGGLASSMDQMIRSILASKVPVLTFVHPPGSRCGSAGVYIMYASHLNGMAPATNIGSATPVMMGGGGDSEKETNKENEISEKAGSDDAVNLKRKQINDAVEQIRGLAQYHGRNETFAVNAVLRAENITSSEAKKIRAIDILSDSEEDFLKKAHGKRVRMSDGYVSLDVSGKKIISIEPSFRLQFLSIIANPNLAYMLMMLGILGIVVEVQNPGLIFPGVLGAMSILIALYAMQTLPINYAGLGLIVLGILFLILEVNIVSFGMLTVAGLTSIVIGSIMLFDSDDDLYRVSLELVISTSLVAGLTMLLIFYKAAESMRKKPVSGSQKLLTETGVTRTEVTENAGSIFIHSEIWQARSYGKNTIPKDSNVKIVSRDGLVLYVEEE